MRSAEEKSSRFRSAETNEPRSGLRRWRRRALCDTYPSGYDIPDVMWGTGGLAGNGEGSGMRSILATGAGTRPAAGAPTGVGDLRTLATVAAVGRHQCLPSTRDAAAGDAWGPILGAARRGSGAQAEPWQRLARPPEDPSPRPRQIQPPVLRGGDNGGRP